MGETKTESMNQELQDWIKETRQIPQEENKPDQSQKKPQGKCMICGQNDAKFICIKCEHSVCPDCYFKIIGVCKHCVPENILKKWEGKTPDWGKILGVQWVD